MEIRGLRYDDFIIYKGDLSLLLIESYVNSFQISEDMCKDIVVEKINQLDNYIQEEKATVLGAFNDDVIVGFVWFYNHDYFGQQRMHINHIVVHKQFRGKGIAKKLINSVVEIAKFKGIETVDLFVSEANVEALNLYNMLGFNTERRYLSKKLL